VIRSAEMNISYSN